MKFTGQELIKLGVPPTKVKFCVNKEFEDEKSIFTFLEEKSGNKPATQINKDNSIFEWIWATFNILPMILHGKMPVPMSRSELRRIMDSRGLLFNGRFIPANAEFENGDFPIKEFVWFPKSERKTTWV